MAATRRTPLAQVSSRAVHALSDMTGRQPIGVSGVERQDEGWRLEIDVVELLRVPDTTSVLATYEVEVDDDGELQSYRRVRRFNRASTEES